MKVKEIVRKSVKTSRVRLDDGREAKVPTELLEQEFEASDFVDYHGLVYKTLKKIPRKPKVLESCRSIEDFDVEAELNLLKSIIIKYRTRGLVSRKDSLDDLVSDIFLHFWERNFFLGYNSEKCSYTSYLSCGVKRFLIDKKRRERSSQKNKIKVLSLDDPISEGSNSTRKDFVADENQNVENDVIASVALKELQKEIAKWDVRCTNITYSQAFKILTGEATIESLIKETGVTESIIQSRLSKIKNYFRAVFVEGEQSESFSTC